MNTAIFTQLSENEVRALVRTELESFFADRTTDHAPKNNLPDLGGIDMAVEVTGLAKPTIYAAVQRREIPHMKKGKKLYFKRSELQAWIESGRKPTTADIESVADRLQIGKGKKKGRNNG